MNADLSGGSGGGLRGGSGGGAGGGLRVGSGGDPGNSSGNSSSGGPGNSLSKSSSGGPSNSSGNSSSGGPSNSASGGPGNSSRGGPSNSASGSPEESSSGGSVGILAERPDEIVVRLAYAGPELVTPPGDPWEIAEAWLPPNAAPDRPQMTVSTVSADGTPDARTVLLSEFDRGGFFFHTDARSRKAADIAANPRVALTILWPGFTRQLVVQGTAAIAPSAEIAAAYRSRSLYLQQLAWQNTHAFAQLPLEERRSLWASFATEHTGAAEDDLPQPASWTGYRVRPTRFTFWGSNPDTASRRVEYTLVAGRWALAYLPG